MTANANLHKAKNEKNDEFYTQLTDVAKELMHYKEHFKDKIVLCNCDDPTWSAFWKYFHLNFTALGLKKLISTHYDKTMPTYKMEYAGGNDDDIEAGVKTALEGNGDFRNQECLELLDEADIVVTNPPFSLFREYVAVLMEYNKKFLIIGTLNAVKYKEIFPLFKDNKVWLGANDGDMAFMVPANSEPHETRYWVDENGQKWRSLGNTIWLTNMDLAKRHEKLILWKHYTPAEFPTYDNYDAIDCSKVSNIPDDINKVIGVPITFFTKYNPEQFEIVGKLSNGTVNGRKLYERILIRKKHTVENLAYPMDITHCQDIQSLLQWMAEWNVKPELLQALNKLLADYQHQTINNNDTKNLESLVDTWASKPIFEVTDADKYPNEWDIAWHKMQEFIQSVKTM